MMKYNIENVIYIYNIFLELSVFCVAYLPEELNKI